MCLGSMVSTLAWDRSSGGRTRGAGCGGRDGLKVKGADTGLQGPRKVKRTGYMHRGGDGGMRVCPGGKCPLTLYLQPSAEAAESFPLQNDVTRDAVIRQARR